MDEVVEACLATPGCLLEVDVTSAPPAPAPVPAPSASKHASMAAGVSGLVSAGPKSVASGGSTSRDSFSSLTVSGMTNANSSSRLQPVKQGAAAAGAAGTQTGAASGAAAASAAAGAEQQPRDGRTVVQARKVRALAPLRLHASARG